MPRDPLAHRRAPCRADQFLAGNRIAGEFHFPEESAGAFHELSGIRYFSMRLLNVFWIFDARLKSPSAGRRNRLPHLLRKRLIHQVGQAVSPAVSNATIKGRVPKIRSPDAEEFG